jgi:hypothetical protein
VSEEWEDQMRTRFTATAAIAVVAPDLRLRVGVSTAARRCPPVVHAALVGIDALTA